MNMLYKNYLSILPQKEVTIAKKEIVIKEFYFEVL